MTRRKSYSVSEWCDRHGFSRGFYYLLLKRGKAPVTFSAGRLKRISEEADADWVAAREAETRAAA
jgi:hypothetical protein